MGRKGGGFGEEITYIDSWSLKEVDGLLTNFLLCLEHFYHSFYYIYIVILSEPIKKFTPVNTHFNSKEEFPFHLEELGVTQKQSYRGPRKAAESKDNWYLH